MSYPSSNTPRRVSGATPALVLFLLGCLCCGAAFAQGAPPDGHDKRRFGGTYVAVQGYETGRLDAALADQGFPRFGDYAVRIGIESQAYRASRHVLGSRLYYDQFVSDGTGLRNAGASAGALGFGATYGYDLLYPGAWNLLLGVELGVAVGRLVTTTSENVSGAVPNFAAPGTRNRLAFGTLYATPALTLQSVEFGKVPTRVTLGVGYRLGTDATLSREGIPGAEFDLDIGARGLYASLGILSHVASVAEQVETVLRRRRD